MQIWLPPGTARTHPPPPPNSVKCDSLGQVLDCQPEGAEVWSPQGLGRAAAPDTQLAQSGQIYLQRFAHLELRLLGSLYDKWSTLDLSFGSSYNLQKKKMFYEAALMVSTI